MYPFLRMAKEILLHRGAADLGPFDTHVSHHLCLPWDIDPWKELNNGRTLTLYDLGRIPLARRTGMVEVLRAQRWGLAVAGASVRYRKRVRMFDRIEMRSRLLGWDARFFYMDQSMWRRDGDCSGQILLRSALTDRNGIVPPARLAEAMGIDPASPPLPEWVAAWIAAEGLRPWPPNA